MSKTVSELPEAISLPTDALLPVVVSGNSRRTTVATLQAEVASTVADGLGAYETKADADADIANIAADAFVQVLLDEDHSDHRTIYQKSGGVLVFKKDLSLIDPFSGRGTRHVFDYFDRADTALLTGETAPTGEVWQHTGTGVPAVENGMIINTGTANTYPTLDYGGQITRIAAAFSFHPDDADQNRDGQAFILIASGPTVLEDMAAHLAISPNGWTYAKRIGAGAIDNSVATGVHNLKVDGTIYQCAVEIDGDTVTIIPPNGDRVVVEDTDIGAMSPNLGTWELGYNAGHCRARVHAASMGGDLYEPLAVMGSSDLKRDITELRGRFINERRQQRGIYLSGGAGWYRIAKGRNFSGFSLRGTLRISAVDSSTYTFVELDLNAQYNFGLDISQNFCAGNGSITIARLSRNSADASGTGIALDVYVPHAREVILDLDGLGGMEFIAEPTVGATALATASEELTFYSGYNANKLMRTKQLVHTGIDADTSITFLNSPSSGFSETVPANSGGICIFGGSTLAEGTVTMPASPVDGQICVISSSIAITTFTLSPNTSQNLANAPTSLTAGQVVRRRWVASIARWMPY